MYKSSFGWLIRFIYSLKGKRWRSQISNAFLIVHHNLYQLFFSVKFNPNKAISYINEIGGKWKSKYNEHNE